MQKHIDHLRNEVDLALKATYTLQQFMHCLANKDDVEMLNRNAQFWMFFEKTVRLQVFVSLRRIFESQRDTHNFQKFIDRCVENIHLFTKSELRKRKLVGWDTENSAIDDFLLGSYDATVDDIYQLSRLVRERSNGIKARYIAISSKVMAHAVLIDHKDIGELYKGTTIAEIEKALLSVWHCYNQVWQMYHNGRKPDFEIGSYSYEGEVKRSLLLQVRGTESV